MKKYSNLQLTIEMPKRTALGREDFLVNKCNISAVNFIDNFYKTDSKSGILIGSKGSGKTHLVNVFCNNLNKENWYFLELNQGDIFDIFSNNDVIIIENIEKITSKEEEIILFHSVNLSKELSKVLLLTSSKKVSELNIQTPDLRSRLEAMQITTILEPDDILMEALIIKLFNDRQLVVKPKVVNFLMQRVERSYLGIMEIIDFLDNSSLSQKKSISIKFINELLN